MSVNVSKASHLIVKKPHEPAIDMKEDSNKSIDASAPEQTCIEKSGECAIFTKDDNNIEQELSLVISNTPCTGKRKLKTLSLSEKMQLLKEIEKGNRKKKDIAKEFGIPPSTLSTIYKSRDKLQEFAEVVDSKRKRLKKAKHPDVEEETLKWLLNVQDPNTPISGLLIREKAQWFAQMLGHTDFQASVGWLDKFRSRYLYIVKTLQKKAACANENDFQKWAHEIIPKIIKTYEEQNIFCAKETCLFYKCFLEKNMAKKGNYFSEEQVNEWVTLLLTTNMSGSEKLPVLTIGKLQNPLCISHIKSSPINYECSKQASMNPDIFESWLKKLDDKFSRENRKIALIINDDRNQRKIKENMKAIKVYVIPSNLASAFQPMDQGIIKCFKYFYRKNAVLKFISSLNNSKTIKTSMLNCIRDVHMSWENVSPSVISGSFRKAGFFKNNNGDISDLTSPIDSESIQEEWRQLKELSHIPSDMTFESYVNIDENFMLLTHISDNEIINELLYGDKESENDEDSKSHYIPSLNEVSFASENIRHFIESRENVPNSVFQAIAHIDQYLLKEECSHEMNQMQICSILPQ